MPALLARVLFVAVVSTVFAAAQQPSADPDMQDAVKGDKGAIAYFEYRAIAIPANEKTATQILNTLAADRWEYVGPLGNTLVAFKRPVPPSTIERLAKPERDRLQGVWRVVSGKLNDGKKVEVERLTFKDDKVTVTYKDGTNETLRYKIIPLGNPKGLDIVAMNSVSSCVYEFDADQLKICGNNGGPRPVEFGDGGFTLVLKKK
jgi:uncharacterized protein (TIGR03067 family)